MKICHTCGEPFFFALTRKGRLQPLNPERKFITGVDQAEIVLVGFGREQRAVVLSEAEQLDGWPRYRYTAHAVTCQPRQQEHVRAA